jgi:L-fuconolactonase
MGTDAAVLLTCDFADDRYTERRPQSNGSDTMYAGLSRRRFLATSAALGTAALAVQRNQDGLSQAQAAPERVAHDAAIPVVDTHQHLWDLTKVRLPWLNDPKAAHLRHSFVTKDYEEVNVSPDQQEVEADYVIKLCQSPTGRMRGAVIGGSPQSSHFGDYIKKFATNPYVKGVRIVLNDPDRPRGLCLERTFVRNMQLLGELGLSFDFCIRPGELMDAVRLMEQAPKTRFIIDHCGNRDVQATDEKSRRVWEQGMKAAAEHEHVMCKISGIVATATPKTWQPADLEPAINFCLETFGPNRVFFGGDWPVCTKTATFRQWFDALTWILRDRTPEFRRKLLHDNAVRFYRLT